MGTDKRERKKANRQARLAAEQAAEARRRQIRFLRNAAILVVAVIVVGFLLAGCGDDEPETGRNSDGSSETAVDDGSSPTTAATAATYGEGACPPVDGADEPVIDFDDAPKRCIDPDKRYVATIETTEGTVEVELDTDRTPITTNNFVVLARYGYYDGTDLFRTVASAGIVQGGSPHTQDNGDPGPGYTIPDEGLPFSSDDYGPGTLAMARTQMPDSASAQFFFLANEGGRYLGDPSQPGAGTYVAFGKVTDGLDVLEAIAALEVAGTQAPSKPVTIEKVTIAES